MPDCQVATEVIVAVNVCVWLMWQWETPPFDLDVMVQYFTNHHGNPPASLLLSTFSHIDLLHLYINMNAFYSMASVVCAAYGSQEMVAVYVMGGVVASVVSLHLQQYTARPRSLGASGAVAALFGVVSVVAADIGMSLMFVNDVIPHSLPAGVVFVAVTVFELVGLALNWTGIDHAAHLGGMVFGCLYAKNRHWWNAGDRGRYYV